MGNLVGTFASTLVGISAAYFIGAAGADMFENSMGNVLMAFQHVNN